MRKTRQERKAASPPPPAPAQRHLRPGSPQKGRDCSVSVSRTPHWASSLTHSRSERGSRPRTCSGGAPALGLPPMSLRLFSEQ